MRGEITLSAPTWEQYVHAVAAREARVALAKQELARRSLLDFTVYFHPNYKVGWFNKELCELLDAFVEAVERQLSPCLLISAPPRHGKSELVSVKLPAYCLGKHPDWEIVCATYGQDLATDFGAKVRGQVTDPRFRGLFPELSLDESSRAKDNFLTTVLGGYKAVGIGGALTGRGAHILDIDDPVKDKEEADSEVMRERAWNWYNTVAATRLHPGGGKIITQCMVGDTRVRMADSTEKLLRDLQPGDEIATYDAGRLTTTRVRKWASQGSDEVFAITMTSGTGVIANARHPFLVARAGGLEWVRLKHLRAGDRALVVSAGCSATTVTSSLGECLLPSDFSAPSNTCDFTLDRIVEIAPAGVEEVFDIEVERTENFIANGLVSHNTRWHEDDLTGRVEEQASLEPEGEQWTKFTYKALAEEDEYRRDPTTGKPISPPVLLRKKGESLHPERYSAVWLERRKKSMPVRDWSALFQQDPVPATGIVFDISWFKWYRDSELPTNLTSYLTTDLAISEKTHADFTVCWPFGLDQNKSLWFKPDMIRERGLKQGHLAPMFVEQAKRHKCSYVVIEAEKLWLTFKEVLEQEMAKHSVYFGIEAPPPTTDPVTRAGPLVGMMQLGRVYFPESLKELILREFLAFPAGKRNDTVSAASWAAWLVRKLPGAAKEAQADIPDEAPAWSYDWKKARTKGGTDTDFAARHKPRRINGKAR